MKRSDHNICSGIFHASHTLIVRINYGITSQQSLYQMETFSKLNQVRSPLLGACNPKNRLMQRHFYRLVYF